MQLKPNIILFGLTQFMLLNTFSPLEPVFPFCPAGPEGPDTPCGEKNHLKDLITFFNSHHKKPQKLIFYYMFQVTSLILQFSAM